MTYEAVSYDTESWQASREFFPREAPDLYETIGRTDAIADEESAAERTVAGGRCTLCEEDAPELLPWSGERLCWTCVDLQLDLLAKAVMDAGAVPVVMAVV